jgi:hypothetical protein
MSPKRPPELQAVFDLVERGGPYESVEEANRVMAARIREYNARPQADLGGMSPDQMRQLLYGDWISSGALRLAKSLTLEDLGGAPILADARTILCYVRDKSPVKETAARNLPRAVVAELLPRLRMRAQSRHAIWLGEPVPLNEGDDFWLPVLRHVLMFAGLLIRRKGLRISMQGRELLEDSRAGDLYTLLFRTLFRVFDLRALGADDRHPELQSTIAYSFYKLRTAARNWASAEVLARTAWLDSARDPPGDGESRKMEFRNYVFRCRVLNPLVQFGLLEERVLPSADRWVEKVEYRHRPLFERFLRFEFAQGDGRDPLYAL